MARPSASSSSSSLEVRKITGTELNSRTRRSSSIPSSPGILMSNTPRSGGLSLIAFRAIYGIGIDASDEAFLLKRDRHRRQDVPVVVDEGDHLAHCLRLHRGRPMVDALGLSQRAGLNTRQRQSVLTPQLLRVYRRAAYVCGGRPDRPPPFQLSSRGFLRRD